MLFIYPHRMCDIMMSGLALTADAAVDTLGTAATVCLVTMLTAACRWQLPRHQSPAATTWTLSECDSSWIWQDRNMSSSETDGPLVVHWCCYLLSVKIASLLSSSICLLWITAAARSAEVG